MRNDDALLTKSPDPIRRGFLVAGQVQGVGFRPFVYRLALAHSLTGQVRNTPDGVLVETQGPAERVAAFGRELRENPPPLARLVSCRELELPLAPEETEFQILLSDRGEHGGHQVLVSPDVATCADCLADMRDTRNRRYRYPFTNCTNCGPRYTIIRDIPYDRASTSMACFPLCPDCAREYQDPLDRRFHAQPNACPVCGPRVWLTGPDGIERESGQDAIDAAALALAQGKILALKGLGGFHLACLAAGPRGAEATAELRRRKKRPGKPLALMVPDLDAARRIAQLTPSAEALLESPTRPITLCTLLPMTALSPDVSPDTALVGLMLPYTPLHHVLFDALRAHLGPDEPPALVMTSGNASSEPICLGNREALRRLAPIADLFLLHNRDILIRTDDSVVRPQPESEAPRVFQFLRRARGYTPEPVFLAESGPPVLGLGPELKNTVCLTKADQAFVSQHIGDMQNLETFGFYKEIIRHLQTLLETAPVALVHDLHPDYLSTQYALEQTGLPVLSIQHHYAHAHAVLAENKHVGPALAWALDGTGLGEDGTLWGGELLYVDTRALEHRRLCHFSPFRLPGGEAAIREPWRIAQSCLWELGVEQPKGRAWPWLPAYAEHSGLLPTLLRRGLRAPVTTSCGRLFDAVAALLGLALEISYEGQAAIRLENAQDLREDNAYVCSLDQGQSPARLRTLELFQQVAEDWERGVPTGAIARRFHLGLVQGLADAAAHFADAHGVKEVALSGGVMQNLTLAVELPKALLARGLTPLAHSLLPPNDACISLGQAAWGRAQLSL
jgi:hydrogenase maturation protein HypF